MIKLKKFVEQGQNVQPSAQNPLEPAQQPVQKPVAPVAPVPPKQKVAPQQKQVTEPVGASAKIQNQIFNIKIRLNQLALNTAVKKFQTTLQSFKSKVTRNTTDKALVQKYLAPLLGDVESLKGNIESLEAELRKLDKMTQIEEQ
jgi:predicted  nucleic acid-binding Zn-ribbon protein